MSAVDVLADYPTIRDEQEALYRRLHAHPELSHAEHATSAEAARVLHDAGFDVREGIGGTGVVGVLVNGSGPVVLLRADMDALPIREQTGAAYASTATTADGEPVMHGCGHDVHVACLAGAARLFAGRHDAWSGTLIALFQPAEETGDGARAMIDDGLADDLPTPDVALGQHVLPGPAGSVATRPGAVLSAADSMRITVHGRGGHGSMPQNTVDPVVIAAMIVVRLQTVVARETAATEPVVLTVGSIRAGTKSNIIPDSAVLELNLRTYDERVRTRVLAAIRRIVEGECAASAAPRAPEFEMLDAFPLTENDPEATDRVATAFAAHFGERAGDLALQTASEDFSDVPRALGAPYTYWGIGGTDPAEWERAVAAGTVLSDIPANHSPRFLPVIQPTLETGTAALVVAACAWFASRG